MKDELDRLREEKDKAEQELYAAKKRFKEAEQAWFRCLERRLFSMGASKTEEVAK